MEETISPQRSNVRAVVDFFPSLVRGSPISLEKQLVQIVREAILRGQLRPGMRLPSSRHLAAELHVNRNTVVSALEQLIADEYLVSKHGSGTFVNEQIHFASETSLSTGSPPLIRDLPPLPQPAIVPLFHNVIEFRVCQPSTKAFPLEQWRKVWRQVTLRAPTAQYSNPAGEPGLREAVADYLAHARGLRCTADDLVITCGALQGFSLVTQALLRPGMTVAMEEPGYPLARQIFAQHAASIVPVPVDEHGLCVERLPEGGAAPRLVYVTPSHQFPLGVRLSQARRMALLEWATRNDAFILEDDYDSEFRYDAPPLPPLASLDRTGRVVYVGTFSKALAPSLRVGYVLSPLLREHLTHLKCWTDYHTNTLIQLALEQFLKEGYFAQHIRRMRRVYAEKRATLLRILEPLQGVASARGLEAGLHIFMEWDIPFPTEQLVQQCFQHGLLLADVARYYASLPDTSGVVLGYGGLDLHEIEWAGRQLISMVQTKTH
ncbi:MAG TPA: PLP-dependent aminotransferase family protein [Ktedonobacteraceae bacterium]|nr:PLP-dependent aminotransferase family protein [Ktedonobacteraceae bacterium]